MAAVYERSRGLVCVRSAQQQQTQLVVLHSHLRVPPSPCVVIGPPWGLAKPSGGPVQGVPSCKLVRPDEPPIINVGGAVYSDVDRGILLSVKAIVGIFVCVWNVTRRPKGWSELVVPPLTPRKDNKLEVVSDCRLLKNPDVGSVAVFVLQLYAPSAP